MPHSKEQEETFQKRVDFIYYLEHELPEDEKYIYRHKQRCCPGLFIMTFKGFIVGEFIVLRRDDIDLELQPEYKYEYQVQLGSIKIYDKAVPFKDFKQKIHLKAKSTNRRPKIDRIQYEILLEMTHLKAKS